jgi:hypothetical protein
MLEHDELNTLPGVTAVRRGYALWWSSKIPDRADVDVAARNPVTDETRAILAERERLGILDTVSLPLACVGLRTT